MMSAVRRHLNAVDAERGGSEGTHGRGRAQRQVSLGVGRGEQQAGKRYIAACEAASRSPWKRVQRVDRSCGS